MLLLLLGHLMFFNEANGENIVNVDIAASEKWIISPYLATTHMLYTNGADEVYKNGTLVKWTKKNKIRAARYPGGTVAAYWDWENPCGAMNCWSLEPGFKEADRAPQNEWMSLKEYMDFVDDTEIIPLVGVNYNNHENLEWMSEEESVAKAKRQAEYVVNERGYKGAFFYIGNEDSVKKYPERWRKHALAIKQVDPTIKTIFNCNYLNPNALKEIIVGKGKKTGVGIDAVDGAEFHGKWPLGGDKAWAATPKEWMKEVPLLNHLYKDLGTYRDRTKELRETLKEIGVTKDFILANNEFGLNNKRSLYPGFNRYTLSLINLELGLEMFKSGLDMMAFWDNVGAGFAGETMLMDKKFGYRMNPVHFGLEMLWRSVGMKMLEMTTSAYRLHGFCATNGGKKTICYLLNKYETERTFKFRGEKDRFTPMKTKLLIETLVDPDGPLNIQDPQAHWGEVLIANKILKLKKDAKFTHTVPALSFVTLTFTKP